VGFDKNGVYVVQTDIATITSKLFALPSKDVAWTAGNTVSLAHEGIAVGKTLDEVPVIDLYGSKSATASEYFVTRSSPGQTGSNIPLNLILDSVAWSSSVASFSSSASSVPTGFQFNAAIDAQQPALPDIRAAEDHRVFSAYSFGGLHLYALVASGPCSSNCGA